MENKHLLKGIILTSATTGNFDSDVLYFVRTNSGKTDGYLQLNGKKYGTAEEIKALLGELPEGFATWRAFVDSISGATTAITEDIEALSGLTSANTENIETLSGLTSANTENIETLSGLTSANTEDIADLQEEVASLNRDSINEVGYDAEEDKVYLIDNSGNTTGGAVLGLASKIEAVSGLTSANTQNIQTLSGLTSANTENITTLMANSATTGSVDQKIVSAISDLDGTTSNEKPAQNAFVADVTETDGIVTVTYGTLPTETDVTATGDTLVDAVATGHSVTVSATQDLIDAVANANQAVEDIEELSGITSGISDNLAALSAATSGIAVYVETLNADSATTGSVDQKIAAAIEDVNGDVEDLKEAVSANTEAIDTLNGDDTTTGSVAKSIKDAIAGLDGTTANTKPAENAFVADVTETDGIVTVTYGSYPDVTATGDTLVSASATDHAVTVSATQALTDAVAAAGTAVQSVNGESGTAVTINADDIALGTAVVSGSTTILPATSSITQSFDDVYQKIDAASNASKIESTGQTITVTTGATGNNVEVNLETGTASTVDAGHIEIAKNASGELYGMLYYGGDDVE